MKSFAAIELAYEGITLRGQRLRKNLRTIINLRIITSPCYSRTKIQPCTGLTYHKLVLKFEHGLKWNCPQNQKPFHPREQH